RRIERADAGLADVIDRRRRANRDVTEPGRRPARVHRCRVVRVEIARWRRSIGMKDFPRGLVGLEDARPSGRDALVRRRHAATSRRGWPDERHEFAPRVVVEVIERDAGEVVGNTDVGRKLGRERGCRSSRTSVGRRLGERGRVQAHNEGQDGRARSNCDRAQLRGYSHCLRNYNARMTPLSRREFGTVVVAGLPLSALLGSIRAASVTDLVLGVSTSSLRELPRVTGRDNVDEVIRSVKSIGVTHVELAMANVEPAPPSTAPVMGGSASYPRRVVLSPEEVAATNAGARAALRTWRLETGPATFDGVRARFEAAGIKVHACSIGYNSSFTDAEIDATFRQVKAL